MATKASECGLSCLDDLIKLIDAGDVQSISAFLKAKPVGAQDLIDLASHYTRLGHTRRQQDAANTKHAANKKAREFVQDLWHVERIKHSSNINFARKAAERVLKKYAVRVKPETIARDWLKGVGTSRSMEYKANARAYVDGQFFKKLSK